MSKTIVMVLTLGATLTLSGCRAFSSLQDASFSEHEFVPGEKKEVKVTLTARSFEAVNNFRLEFEAPPDISITPTSIEFKDGKPVTPTLVLEVKENATPGPRDIKLKSTPQAGIFNTWHITVIDPAASGVHQTGTPDTAPSGDKRERDSQTSGE